MSTLTAVTAGVMPDNEMALLFLEIADTGRELAPLLDKLEATVERKIDYVVFKGGTPAVIRVRLMPLEARQATVMLGESGIRNFMVLFPATNRRPRRLATPTANNIQNRTIPHKTHGGCLDEVESLAWTVKKKK